MTKNKSVKLIVKIVLALFISSQMISEFHLHFDEHENEESHQCITCHLSSNSALPIIDSNLILQILGILLIASYLQPFLISNNQKSPFSSRAPPLL
tara:strand:+ start:2494 stop:2781 length:288 start_codon:yes stop_codon:yes gene_type:complete